LGGEEEYRHAGTVKYSNKETLEKNSLEIGDVVVFAKDSEYHFDVDGETLYRMRDTDIIAKQDKDLQAIGDWVIMEMIYEDEWKENSLNVYIIEDKIKNFDKGRVLSANPESELKKGDLVEFRSPFPPTDIGDNIALSEKYILLKFEE